MKNALMFGFWRFMLKIPPFLWPQQISKAKRRFLAEKGFMTRDHRLVHHLAVRDLPDSQGPLSPETISRNSGLDLDRVKALLEDLEKHLTFLFRDASGNVVWAYPVTVAETPHQVTFNTGQKVYAA